MAYTARERKDVIIKDTRGYHPYWFSTVILHFEVTQVIKCIVYSIKMMFKSLEYNWINPAETLVELKKTPTALLSILEEPTFII